MTTTIRTRARGPLVVEGPVEIFDAEGNRIDCEGRARIALCRCGASRTKPFCDGSHNRTAFEAQESAEEDVSRSP